MFKVILSSLAFLFTAAGPGVAQADSYPANPIRLINPWQHGGGVDSLARLFAEKLARELGKPVFVESKPGAGGNIGTEFVARSAPDGLTLLINNGSLTTNPVFMKNIPFDPLKDLQPVSLIGLQQFYLVVRNGLPVKSVAELISYAKAHPGRLFYATPGVGTPQHLAGEMLKSMTGIDIGHSPYKGQAPAAAAVMAGEVDMAWLTLNAALPLIQGERVRGIAVSSRERLDALKTVPAIAESVPNYEMYTWVGLFAPAKTPASVIARLNSETKKFALDKSTAAKLEVAGYEVKTSSPNELKALMSAETHKWASVAKRAGIVPE